MQDTPDVVLVQGDTNTVLAGALAAAKLHIKVGHVEAGLRCFDRTMPEEINRIMADHISDYLFAATATSQQHLLAEGIPQEKIFVTGNTVVDAVYQDLEISKLTASPLKDMGLQEKGYFLTTVHRAENTDSKTRLSAILDGLGQVCAEFSLPLIFPAHPRTVKMIHEFGLQIPEGVRIIDPVGYLEFLQLESGARLILTDSGGLQEEACILGVPCVTLRDNTERPETVDVGANIIAGKNIIAGVRQMMQAGNGWKNPYGEGDAGEIMINELISNV
jgi:UDP-N-acetylglucosamine 2-epimerase (non-hydrolysing)